MNTRKFIFVLGIFVFFMVGGFDVYAQTSNSGTELPPMKLEVQELHGEVTMQPDTGQTWKPLEIGDELVPGDQVQTDAGETVALVVPSISLITIQESSRVTIQKLTRSFEEEGVLVEEGNITVNEVGLEALKGKIQNSLRDHENVRNEYELKTPNAVAGIRGTTFECDIDEQSTRCSVLEGNITFQNRFGPEYRTNLGAMQASTIGDGDTEPSPPEQVSDEEAQELNKFQEKADESLKLQPVLSSLSLNGNSMSQAGQGVYKIEIPYSEQRDLNLDGVVRAPEDGAQVENVTVQVRGSELNVDGLQDWSASFLSNPPGPGKQGIVNGQIMIQDSIGSKTTVPFQITLTHKIEEGEVPEGLRDGNVPVSVRSVGGENPITLSFPYEITAEKALQTTTDTDGEEPGITINGQVAVDSPLAGVAVSLDGGQNWEVIGTDYFWSYILPYSAITQGEELNVQFKAWTTDGHEGSVTAVGPFVYASEESVVPLGYETSSKTIEITLSSVAGTEASASDLPISVSSTSLPADGLIVEGTASADTSIEGVAYSLDGGNSWQKANGTDQWSASLPLEQSQTFDLMAVAWNSGQQISEPINFGQIEYTYVEGSDTTTTQTTDSTLPENYEDGNVGVSIETVAGLSISNMEFPYQLYRGDISSDGIVVQGSASGNSTIEGVAYSLDGGKTWTLAEGGSSWSFTISAESGGEYIPQVRAWTVDGVIGDPVSLEKLKYSGLTYAGIIREQFETQWNEFSNQNEDGFIQDFSSDFQFTDSLTGEDFTVSGMENFISDFYNGVRNLRVFYNVNQTLAGQTGGEINFNLEWRGTEDNTDRPFVMFGENSQLKYQRMSNGTFQVVSWDEFPLILYLFHDRKLRIPDLEGIVVDTLEIVNKDESDIIAELMTPDFTVNRIEIGGAVEKGGIRKSSSGSFSGVNSISQIGSGYKDNIVINEGQLYEINIRKDFDKPATALLKVRDLQSNFVEVQMISAQSPPGLQDRIFTNYRGIDPYQ